MAKKTEMKSEPVMGNLGKIIRSKKGNYLYMVISEMEGNVRIKWIMEDGSKTPYSYSRVIRTSQIGGRDYEEVINK